MILVLSDEIIFLRFLPSLVRFYNIAQKHIKAILTKKICSEDN